MSIENWEKQRDGYENEDHFIIRRYGDPDSVWIYWPITNGKVEYFFSTEEEAVAFYIAAKHIRLFPCT